jgi:hypothetical protein
MMVGVVVKKYEGEQLVAQALLDNWQVTGLAEEWQVRQW